MISIECKSAPILAASFNRNFANIDRASRLIKIGEESNNNDIYRACVPILHATFEDCMRNAIYYKLTKSPTVEQINNVPLIGLNNTSRSEKFFLGALLKHESKSIKEVISESVEEYVNRLTFNNTTDLIFWFKLFSINISKIEHLLSDIDELFSRRHNIVHNADIVIERSNLVINETIVMDNNKAYDLCPIDNITLKNWLSITSQFTLNAIVLFLDKNEAITFTQLD